MEIISKKEAKRKRRKRYFTGMPCIHGHISERFINGGHCIECHKKRSHDWRKNNWGRWQELIRRGRSLPFPTRPEPEKCELCGGTNANGHSLCLDHDHQTGLFRGWLCKKCNQGLGLLGDTFERVKKAAEYLQTAESGKVVLPN